MTVRQRYSIKINYFTCPAAGTSCLFHRYSFSSESCRPLCRQHAHTLHNSRNNQRSHKSHMRHVIRDFNSRFEKWIRDQTEERSAFHRFHPFSVNCCLFPVWVTEGCWNPSTHWARSRKLNWTGPSQCLSWTPVHHSTHTRTHTYTRTRTHLHVNHVYKCKMLPKI